jgi:hypothetical protein
MNNYKGGFMKAAKILAILTVFLFLSCQKAPAPESKSEVQVQQSIQQVQKEKVKQQPVEIKPAETKLEIQPKSQKQPLAKTETKEEKKEKLKEAKSSSLTEEEQRLVERIGENILIAPSQYFDSQEDAVEYLKPLLKADHRTIRLYEGYEALNEDKRRQDYDKAISKAIMAIDPNTKVGSEFIIEVLETKREYPRALSEAAKAVKFAKDNRVIPLLKKVVKNQDTTVRLEAAGSLLALDDADTALPVLDDLAKEGETYAIPYLFKSGWGKEWKLWDERGLEIIKKALVYPPDKIKAEAALFLAEMEIEKEKAEEVALKIMEKFKDKTAKDYRLSIEETASRSTLEGDRFYNDGVACDYAMEALSLTKSKRAILALKHISERKAEWWYVCWKRPAEEALKKILENNGGVK